MLPANYLYWIFKPLLKVSWNTAYNIQFIGKENIDLKKPTLLVVNHTNSVIDPVAIAVNVKRGVFFLARGDAFANNFLKWLLWQYHIIPIFRKEEGDNNLEKNQETFGRMFELFDRARPVLIFSEGKCIQEKTIREFRKGTAHILVDYANEKKDTDKLHVQPIGLSYQYYNKFRSDLIINFGPSFTLKELNIDDLNTKESIQIISEKTQERLAQCMVTQSEPELYGMEISIEDIIGKELLQQFKHKNPVQNLFDMRAHITRQSANLYNSKNEKFLMFKNDLASLENKLSEHKIPLSIFNKSNGFQFMSAIFLLITAPFFVAGFLLNAIPFFVPEIIVKKKVKNPVFKSTVRVVTGTFLFLFFYLAYFILIPEVFETETFLQKMVAGLAVVLIAYISLRFSYYWFQLLKEVKGFFAFLFLKAEEKNNIIHLHSICKEWLMKNLLV